MPRKKIYGFILACFSCILCFANNAFAESNLELDMVVGITIPSNNNFEDASAKGISLTWARESLSWRAGYIDLGDFTLDNGSVDTRLEIVANYIELLKVVNTDMLDLEIGLGLAATQAEMYFDGERLVDSNDTRPFVEFAISKSMSERFKIHAGVSWFNDVSGSDITVPRAGVRYSF